MNSDLTKAAALLNSGAYTCVLCRGDAVFTGTERGVKPLLGWLDGGVDLNGFSAADRVVGTAAAFLYVLLGAAGRRFFVFVNGDASLCSASGSGGGHHQAFAGGEHPPGTPTPFLPLT